MAEETDFLATHYLEMCTFVRAFDARAREHSNHRSARAVWIETGSVVPSSTDKHQL